jgi:SAM-dependent methyltransferase
MNLRDRIREGIDFATKTTMEIGPLYRPFVLKSEGDVIYVDHADTNTLRAKYKDDPKFDVSEIVEVDAVWGEQTLADCLGKVKRVDYVIASHVIEHVPDLITWLHELRSVLKTGGEIRLVVPDKRFTFDYTRRLTELPDILDAFLRKTRRPLPLYILDHVMNVRHVDTRTAWAGPLTVESAPLLHSFEMAVHVAKDALNTSNYHDVHCWVFTPHSFAKLMREAAEHDLIDLTCHDCKDTLPNTLEFTVFLRATSDKSAIVESWRRMEESVDRGIPGSTQLDLQQTRDTHLDNHGADDFPENERAQIQRLVVDAQAARHREAHLASALAATRAEVAAYSESTSWKITEPLRKLVRMMRKLR